MSLLLLVFPHISALPLPVKTASWQHKTSPKTWKTIRQFLIPWVERHARKWARSTLKRWRTERRKAARWKKQGRIVDNPTIFESTSEFTSALFVHCGLGEPYLFGGSLPVLVCTCLLSPNDGPGMSLLSGCTQFAFGSSWFLFYAVCSLHGYFYVEMFVCLQKQLPFGWGRLKDSEFSHTFT